LRHSFRSARFGADPDDYDYNTSDGGAEDDGEDDRSTGGCSAVTVHGLLTRD
jgi:hypothetical protein